MSPSAAPPSGIQAIPTFLPFVGGREAARHSGVLPLGQLEQWLAVAGAGR